MYGLIGKATAVAGQRDALAAILLDATGASHKASLGLPAVQAAIVKAKPLIAGFSNRVETSPIGGHGLTG
jgi:hypothetical protein